MVSAFVSDLMFTNNDSSIEAVTEHAELIVGALNEVGAVFDFDVNDLIKDFYDRC